MQNTRATIGAFGTALGTAAILVLGVPGCSGDGGSGGDGTGGGDADAVADADGGEMGGEETGSGPDDTGGPDEDTGGTGGTDVDTGMNGGMDADTVGGGGMDADTGGGPGADADTAAPSDTGGSETGTDTSGGSDAGMKAAFRVVNCASVTPTANVQVGPFYSYQPGEVTVSTGDVVRWNWASSVTLRHNVTAADSQSCTSSNPTRFQSRTTAAAGATFCVEFNRTGQWNYHCTVGTHCSRGMKGRVIVN